MKRGIKHVRESIKRRKRKKTYIDKQNIEEASSTYFLNEEIKHGFYDDMSHDFYNVNRETNPSYRYVVKGVLSLFLFAGIAFIVNVDHSRLEKPKQFAHHVLKEEFPFAKANEWYVATFGQPLALLPREETAQVVTHDLPYAALPVSGQVTVPFTSSKEGIHIQPTEQTAVRALNRGVVIFAGNDRKTNKTVIIQHADGRKTTYGHLSALNVHLYQAVESDDQIGLFNPTSDSETVYFSIEENNSFIDPVQVIEVDTK